MNLTVLLEVAIGLVAIYFLLSIACSFIIEAVNSFANVRGDALKVFVEEMLSGRRDAADWTRGDSLRLLAQRLHSKLTRNPQGSGAEKGHGGVELGIMEHPLIVSLHKPATNMTGEKTAPSYIPPEFFTKALLDRLAAMLAPLSLPKATFQ